MAEVSRVHIVIRGIVQGVGFRYFTMHLARDYGITGWVRNREDGGVEVEAEGDELVVKSFVKDVSIGPRGAHISAVDVESLKPGAAYKGFTVRF
jgi:acylphosphatase